MKQSPNEKIKELQKKIEELEFDKSILLTSHQVMKEDFGIDVKKYLPGQLEDELDKHIKNNPKKD